MNLLLKPFNDLLILLTRLFLMISRQFNLGLIWIGWKMLSVGSKPYQIVRSLVRRQNARPAPPTTHPHSVRNRFYLWQITPTLVELGWQRSHSGEDGPRLAVYMRVNSFVPESLLRTAASIRSQSYCHATLLYSFGNQMDATAREQARNILLHQVTSIPCEELSDLSIPRTEEYILYLKPGDQLQPDCLYRLTHTIESDVISFDLAQQDSDGCYQPVCRPAGISPELMISENYLSRSAIRLTALQALLREGELSPADSLQSDDAVLFLLTHRGKFRHVHLARPLVYLISDPENEQDRLHFLEEFYTRKGLSEVHARTEKSTGQTQLTWQTDGSLVSIIIPSKDKPELIQACIQSIRRMTAYSHYELIVVDNGSTDPETLRFYREQEKEPDFKVVFYQEPFNYSRAINLGAAAAAGKYLLFLNNDIRIFRSDWLTELVQWAMLPDVGVAGAKLLYPDGSIQHAGVVFDPNRVISHIYCHQPDHVTSPHGPVDWYRNYVGVTGACQMMRADLFRRISGYDEAYQLTFSDIDLCVQLLQQGYRTVYNPFSVLYHAESATRSTSNPPNDIKRAMARFNRMIRFEDGYYSGLLVDSFDPRIQTLEPEPSKVLRIRIGGNVSEDGIQSSTYN